MNENDQELRDAFRRAFEGECDAPSPALETRLAGAFREQREQRRARRHFQWWHAPAAFAAVALLAVFAFLALRPNSTPVRVSPPPPPSVASVPRTLPTAPAPVHEARRRVHARRPPHPATAAPAVDEADVAGGFVALTSDSWPLQSGEVIRVEMPARALSGLGLPVATTRAETPVRADVVLDQDGTARAIRLVSAGTNFSEFR